MLPGSTTNAEVMAELQLRPWTPAQRHMAANLVAIGTEHGRVVGDGRVVVPLPLAEVSARSGRGRNCGTLYAHARALRPAVSPNPGSSGLVLDLEALSRIAGEGALGPLPPATQARPHLGPSARPVHGTTNQASPSGHGAPIDEVIALLRDIVAVVSNLVSTGSGPAAIEAMARTQAGLDRLAEFADDPRGTSRIVREPEGFLAESPREPLREGGKSSSKGCPVKASLPPW